MTEPVFDSPRKALGFALNYRLDLPRPAMAKMMADGNVRRIELADGSKVTIMAYRKSERSTQLKGWDGAATAGMVLQHLISLAEPQQWTLMAELMHPTHPCACKAPCCSGHRPNQNWSRTIHRLCDHLRDVASLSKMPGKKGLSTAPGLRLALVERFFVSSRRHEHAAPRRSVRGFGGNRLFPSGADRRIPRIAAAFRVARARRRPCRSGHCWRSFFRRYLTSCRKAP